MILALLCLRSCVWQKHALTRSRQTFVKILVRVASSNRWVDVSVRHLFILVLNWFFNMVGQCSGGDKNHLVKALISLGNCSLLRFWGKTHLLFAQVLPWSRALPNGIITISRYRFIKMQVLVMTILLHQSRALPNRIMTISRYTFVNIQVLVLTYLRFLEKSSEMCSKNALIQIRNSCILMLLRPM